MPTTDDYSLIVLLSAGCSLATTAAKDNWVDHTGGGLPSYICHIAKAVKKDGKSTSAAIAIAVSRVKKWAAGGDDVDADTQAKATAAVAEWEALKAKNKAGQVVKASRSDDSEYLMLTNIPSYNTNIVRSSWDAVERDNRRAWNLENPRTETYGSEIAVESYYPYRWIKEVWTDFILVEREDSKNPQMWKYPFTVHPLTKVVTFGEPVEVATVYLEISPDLTDAEKSLLTDLLG